jgi:hypothetical protein
VKVLSLAPMLARLFSAWPVLQRIDLATAAAQAGGLDIVEICLAPADFAEFHQEAATHLMISLAGGGATYRDHPVRGLANRESHLVVRDGAGDEASRLPLGLAPQ